MSKSHRLAFRVNEGQRAFLMEEARKLNATVSDYLRAIIERRMIEKARGNEQA